MRTFFFIATSVSALLLASCASSVAPEFVDASSHDVPVNPADVRDAQSMCPVAQRLCAGRCADTSSDGQNCGACGRACSSGVCSGGACVTACAPPQMLCSGRCTDVTADAMNCGRCGLACTSVAMCAMGVCAAECSMGTTLCRSGCADLLSDPANCSSCGRACPSVAGGVATCTLGVCGNTCLPGRTACGTQCDDLSSDASNCGRCGLACGPGQSCISSLCQTPIRRPPGAYPAPFAPLPTTGMSVVDGDDTTSGPLPLGFTFRFFGVAYTSVNISSNGFLGFDTVMSQGCCAGGVLPSADAVNNIVAAAWTDLFPPGSPLMPNAVTAEGRGTAPNRYYVVSWTSVPWCCAGVAPQVTTQIVLHETTDQIDIFTTVQNGGHVYSQGAEDPTGTMAYFIPGRSAADYALMNDGVVILTN